MSVSWFDAFNDGMLDLYVANMWTAAGTRLSNDPLFQREAPEAVQALYRKHAMGNSLFRNSGNSTFSNVTNTSQTGMGRWSWSSDAWDFDHDGFQDLYVTNGMISGTNRQDLNSFFCLKCSHRHHPLCCKCKCGPRKHSAYASCRCYDCLCLNSINQEKGQ